MMPCIFFFEGINHHLYLFVGIIPPLSLEKWMLTFSLYKEIPEFKLLNQNMTLDEFKTIFGGNIYIDC